jgi:hypothetical protein
MIVCPYAYHQSIILIRIYHKQIKCFHVCCPICPPLGKELYVGTTLYTVPNASTYNTKVRFPNCIVQRVFSRACEDRAIFLQRIILGFRSSQNSHTNVSIRDYISNCYTVASTSSISRSLFLLPFFLICSRSACTAGVVSRRY